MATRDRESQVVEGLRAEISALRRSLKEMNKRIQSLEKIKVDREKAIDEAIEKEIARPSMIKDG